MHPFVSGNVLLRHTIAVKIAAKIRTINNTVSAEGKEIFFFFIIGTSVFYSFANIFTSSTITRTAASMPSMVTCSNGP